MTTICPNCDNESDAIHRCDECGKDLVGVEETDDKDTDTGDPPVMSDGGEAQGAIDNDWEENELSAREQMLEAYRQKRTTPIAGSIVLDLGTGQPMFVRKQVEDNLVDYYVENDFDLLNYKQHPYLPVTIDDPVYECVFITTSPDSAHKPGKTYDYPEGRLCVLPIEQAWEGDES